MANILVVDDALMMRKAIGNLLGKAGHTVIAEAANGEQAVAAYIKYRPDLVTMDITMPDVDGIDALGQIRAFDPEAKVVMVSALGQKHKVFDALQNGAKAYILKPFTEDKLMNVLNELLGTAPGASSGFQPELVPMAWDQNRTGKPAFSVENQRDGVVITMRREFAPLDFGELAKAVEDFLASKCSAITFDFTCSPVLQGKTAAAYRQILERVVAGGTQLQIKCYAQEYVLYLRGASGLSKAELTLVKQQDAL